MNRKYVLKLAADERDWLEGIVRTGKSAAWKIRHANAFLKMDRGEQGPAWEDARIAEAFGTSTRSLENWRKQAVEEGPREVLERYYPTRPQRRRLDGQAEAQLVKLACSQAPGERTGWTLNLLANKLVELVVVASISRETVRRTLKKDIKPWLKQQWCIAPERDADFACQMEQVLEVYCRPYDAGHPVICMDEQPKQLLDQVRMPVPAQPGAAAKEDIEYVRQGMHVVWIFVEPLAGWRAASVTLRKTAVDWPHQVREVVEATRYAQAQRITLVCDNLNVHRLASLYEAFALEEALRLARKLALAHTPKHGSWLNMAEPELSVLTRQCLDQRIGQLAWVSELAQQWAQARNRRQAGIDWQLRTPDVRIKLKYLYPKIEE